MIAGRAWDKMRRMGLFCWIGAILLLISACQVSAGANTTEISSPQSPFPTMAQNSTTTPTPFLPLGSTGTIFPTGEAIPTLTPTITATPEPPWKDFTGPTRESDVEILPPVPKINFPSRVVNILLLGSDEAPQRYGHRTDTIMILSLDPEADKATLLSIPRDLYVYVPGWKVDRINVADLFGGSEMVYETMLYNFGIEIDHWVRVNFNGFEDAVSLLGGIDVQVGRYLTDECGGITYAYSPGTYHMDGVAALCYVRMRKTTSDFDRLRRQQEVMQALFRKVLSLDGLTRLPQLYSQFRDLAAGDIGLDDLLPLVPLASRMASGSASFAIYSIDVTMVTPIRAPSSGAAVLLPQPEKIQELLRTAFNY
jgi:LCP family protein required for cell wall assembly